MPIILPKIRKKNCSVSDIIREQITLCEQNIKTINFYAVHTREREIKEEINRRLRICNDFLGMRGSRKGGCLYFQKGLETHQKSVCEHVIPVAELVRLYQEGHSFKHLIFYPIARISKESDDTLCKHGYGKRGFDLKYPFRRYSGLGIEIKTHFGDSVDIENWSMQNHWNLVEKTTELRDVLGKLRISMF